ncbi:hypothetical protein [Hymenobacter psychrophilus]|uniref:hypothetical protein n=1 Tax=Hymenobacter psychrophilus TaxID=651662 RepID=UPI001114C3E3|nr:hypothetical protein [Hymenobacter psychrophilus]
MTTIYIARAYNRSWWWVVPAVTLPLLSTLLIILAVIPESRRRERVYDAQCATERVARQALTKALTEEASPSAVSTGALAAEGDASSVS